MIGLRNFGRARTRGIPSIPSSVGKISKIVPDALNPPAKLSPPVKPVLVKPLPTKLSPYIDLTTTGSRTAIPPPRALVDGVMSILKGRDIAGIRTHFADMEASLDARDQSMVRESLRSQAPGHGGAYGSSPPLLYGPKETLAFVLHRMMPLFAVETAVLREVAASLPSFQPKSCLDFGSGPGTGVFASKGVFPSLSDFVLVEPSRSMSQVAEHLLYDTSGVMYRRSLAEVHRYHKRTFDLVLANQTLGELCSHDERMDALEDLWKFVSPGGVLVLTERGSRWGFSVIQSSREALILSEQGRQEARGESPDSQMALIGPCPHSGKCPMVGTQWCHFAQTGHRLKILQNSHKRATNTPAIATARYSYVTFHKPQDSSALLLHPPTRRIGVAGTSQDAVSIDDMVDESMGWIAGRFPSETAGSSAPNIPLPRSLSSEAVQAAFHRAFAFKGDEVRDADVAVDVDVASDDDEAQEANEVLSEGSDTDDGVDGAANSRQQAAELAQERKLALRDEISKAFTEKVPGAGEWSRIVRPPLAANKHILLDLCTPEGVIERRIPSKGKLKKYPGAYRAARKAGWGGLWPHWLARPKNPTEFGEHSATKPSSRQRKREEQANSPVGGDDDDAVTLTPKLGKTLIKTPAVSRKDKKAAPEFSEDSELSDFDEAIARAKTKGKGGKSKK